MVSGGTVCAELKERGGHQVPSLLGGPHHGDEQRFDVEIEQSLDQLDVARNGPNQAMIPYFEKPAASSWDFSERSNWVMTLMAGECAGWAAGINAACCLSCWLRG
jgi:hypothetical protein